MPLIEVKGDLFSVAEKPAPVILAHACNAKGRWGRGIALGFKARYPDAYTQYLDFCRSKDILGKGPIFRDANGGLIGCLITSKHFSPPDDCVSIMHNTKSAVRDLIRTVQQTYPGYDIHSNLFNSGLFEVPWQMTRYALIEALEELGDPVTWKVWHWNQCA